MPDSLPDFSATCTTYERKLRGLKRTILGIADVGKEALEDPTRTSLFKAKLAGAQANWESYQKVWDDRDSLQVHSPTPDAWPDKGAIADYDKVYNEICQATAYLMQIDDQVIQATGSELRSNSTMHPSTAFNTSGGFMSADSHLPKIEIPHFYGDLLQWSHFQDTFTSMVHNEPSISNIKKFHYLRSALKGEAATLLSRIPVDERSYDQAWDKLVKTYDNPRILASLYVQRILQCDATSPRTELQRYERFLNDVADGIAGFRNLNIPDKADFLLSSLALRALDPQTRNNFEISHKPQDTAPTADEVIDFVRKRVNAIKLSRNIVPSNPSSSSTSNFDSRRSNFPQRSSLKYNPVSFHTTKAQSKSPRSNPVQLNGSDRRSTNYQGQLPVKTVCSFCRGPHSLSKCFQFSDLPTGRRIGFVNGWRGCKNCLQENHKVSECPSRWSCRFCRKRHHSLIHIATDDTPSTFNISTPLNSPNDVTPQATFSGFGSNPSQMPTFHNMVLLGTVQVLVQDYSNNLIPARAILDSGSQQTFISRSLASRLKLPIKQYVGWTTGLGGVIVSKPSGITDCVFKSYVNSDELHSQAVIVNNISPSLPSSKVPDCIFDKFSHLNLSDRTFDTPGAVDVLIGADLYPMIVTGCPQQSPVPNLFLLPTIFGLSVIGKLNESLEVQPSSFFNETSNNIEAQLKRFWELEEPDQVNRSHPDDQYCEDHFKSTFTRTSEGRYIVRLPFKPPSSPPGDNREQATRRFLSLERRLSGNSTLSLAYGDFMKEYLSLNHMTIALSSSKYLIPHHGIWQGAKLRVVFDASCSCSNGASLNSVLLSGPKLQSDICSVLTRFRMYSIPLCADIVKMYRQILIHPDDRPFQHILWRDNPGSPLVEMELNTVTYGVRPSPFLALRVIKQLILDEGGDFPLAADRALKDSFVDDFVTGADTLDEALELKRQLCGLFSRGGFSLSKWVSTEPSLLPDTDINSLKPVTIKSDETSSVKILGLVWDPKSDLFSYRIQTPTHLQLTKRLVLSSICKIFDPLGFLSPVILSAKTLFQDIWKAEVSWDDPLSKQLANSWHSIFDEWSHLSSVSIPRYATLVGARRHLIGFCDASTKGYAAAVYLRSEALNGQVTISLIKAKTRVAPLKFVSIARLELCGALLLSRVMASITIDGVSHDDISCYTDSSNVLAWLNIPVHSLKVFEANRVSQILSAIPLQSWSHISSNENPCDIGSRGCTPSQLMDFQLWWCGPSWLKKPFDLWPHSSTKPSSTFVLATVRKPLPERPSDDWTERFSSFNTLIRTVAWILRFKDARKSVSLLMSRPISASDFRVAKTSLVRLVQRSHFRPELFSTDVTTPKELQQLSPFLDELGIIRVGGRLQNSLLELSAKHPALIPNKSHLARLIVQHFHESNFHAGSTLVLALLRSEFWIPKAPKLIRGCILRCVHCRKLRAKPITPLMAPLPKDRFVEQRAFLHTGVDFAGPFLIKESSRRNASIRKSYLCIFVCMGTKAVHLEAVSSLSTAAFLAALDRFTARRGLPQIIWSDNGTNFVGASRFIKDVFAFLVKEEHLMTEKLSPLGVEWKFIPPRAPHFGGLWEAGVRSVKNLLSSTIGKVPYTFEELATTFARIERLLNSRPLCALIEDPDNFNFLTPGHFLIGSSLTALPQPSESHNSRTIRSRWSSMESQIITVWNRWRKEYLHSLQQKKKWMKSKPDLCVGDLVIMLERRSLVGQWPVARVVQTFPGRDSVTRTVLVRTPSGNTFIRAVTSLAPLFHEPPEIDPLPSQ